MMAPDKPKDPDLRRFVVLRHTLRTGSHFDLMIENADRLATWKFETFPGASNAKPQPGVRLAEHRPLYLDYEGPVSNDRGDVIRQDSGGCRARVLTEDHWTVEFFGARLTGRYELRRASPESDEWSLHRLGA
ncbi:hypothetical protein B7486_00720 [cyanobacterium TDX16]|nr:hypothetical protein B7486_00720 [cyanobacterium TDX16]